ncbi:META domain-containing protein [Paraferrimonas sp. SM1919]|uniref:META domain-containing protein n=1 Tax=Paraferrimonas sp. SM1919 TaxID=2662263 RepID=UPI0013D56A6E|nr:META domain-containing protein [Paraferrimonas sp. SM1919]
MLKKLVVLGGFFLLTSGCSSTVPIKAPESIVGKWQITQVEKQKLSLLGQSTITFKQDNKVSGFNACNNFFGQYQQQDNQLSFSPMGTTMKACVDSLMQQERKTMQAITQVTYVKGDSQKLQLLNEDHKVLLILNRL